MKTPLNWSIPLCESAVTRSQRGASLPLALLLFMVCSLLASVIITAATSAAGRTAQLAEADQQYYSVMSAAQLIGDCLDNEAVEIECAQIENQDTTVRYSVGGTMERGDTVSTVKGYSLKINGVTVGTTDPDHNNTITLNKSNLTLPELTAIYSLAGSTNSSINLAQLFESSSTGADTAFELGSFNLAHAVTPTSVPAGINVSALQNALAVTMTETAQPGGDVILQFQSAGGEDIDPYIISIWCSADVRTSESTQETHNTVAPTGASLERRDSSEVTTTRKTTFSWKANQSPSQATSEGAGA